MLSGTVSVYIDPRMTGEEEYGISLKPPSAKKKVAKSAKSEKYEKKPDGEENQKEPNIVDGENKDPVDKREGIKQTGHPKHTKRIQELDRTKFGKMIKSYGKRFSLIMFEMLSFKTIL